MYNYLYYAIDTVISVGLILLAVMSLLRQGYKNPINRIFSMFSIVAGIWIVTCDLSNNLAIPFQAALSAKYASNSIALVMLLLMLWFILNLVTMEKVERLVQLSILPLLFVCAIAATPLVIGGIGVQGDLYGVVYGPMTWLYLLGLLYILSLITYGIIYGLRHSSGLKRRQLMSVGIGLAITSPLAVAFTFIIPWTTGQFWVLRLGATPALVLVISLYYSVARYHLFDIRTAVVRTLAYILSLSLLVGIYYALVLLVSSLLITGDNSLISQNPLNIVLIFALLFIFQPIKQFFDLWTNRVFYRDYYDSDAFLDRFNKALASTTNLRRLLEQASREIASTLKSEQIFFFLSTQDGHHLTAGTPAHSQLKQSDINDIYTETNGKGDMVIASLLDANHPVRKLMALHRVEIIMPILRHDQVSYLFLGEHRTSHYTNRDIKVLNMVDGSLAIAIQNALSVEAIRQSNTELRQIDRVKDEFVSVASHELRTPMTVIRGYVSLLQRQQLGPQNEKQQDVLNKISDNAKTLINLVNDMLDLSKFEADKLELSLGTYSVDELIQKSLDQVMLMYKAKGLALTYLPTSLSITTDPAHFDRIMLNLLSNAYKFTDRGGVTVKAKSNEGMVTISVIDTGIGIAKDAILTLFKKFSQVDNYLQRSTGGTGLGLAICERLVTRLGGKIGVTSVEDKGSEFWFEVPVSK
ncbi:MAG: ATP-binding protein [Candidatus Saccharimonadales bacterium]